MIDLTLVVVAADAASIDAFDRTHTDGCDLIRVANLTGCSLASIANQYLDKPRRAVFGLCHTDAYFGPGALAAFTDCAMAGNICGIVGRQWGGETIDESYRWCHRNPGEVSTLDCCSVFLPPRQGWRFDAERFDGYHCHVEDICLQGRARGLTVMVPAADATHRSKTTNGDLFVAEYWRYRAVLAAKWAGTRFITT